MQNLKLEVMGDSYILNLRATIGFSPKGAKKLMLRRICKKHQTLYFVVKFEKLKIKLLTILISWRGLILLSTDSNTPKTNIEQEKIQKKKNKKLSTRAFK